MSWSHYLLQVNIYLIVFYAFYRLLLAKETYFFLNRIYLICSGLCALTIPFLRIDWFSKQEISQQIYVQVEQLNHFMVQAGTEATAEQFNWGNVIVLIYLLGVVFFLVRFTFQLLAIKRMLKGIKSGLAFSFWNKKLVAQNLPEVDTINHHEDIHIKQLHTFDVIFFELLGIITWFNPIIYLYKETVKNIHEYLADEAAAKFQGDKETYSMLLLNQAFGVNNNTLTNGFFKKSMIKKRIFMLYKERSRKTAIVKYGIFVPLLALALLLSSATLRKNEQLLAAAEQIELADTKAVVAEVLNLKEEIPVEVVVAQTKVKFPKPEGKSDENIQAFYKYLGNNIKYPSTAASNHIQGNLVVSFTVNNKKITTITVDPKLGYGTDEEVTTTLAKYNGNDLADDKYSMRIEYRLNGAFTSVLNEDASIKKGVKSLNTITIMGYAIKPPPADDENTVYSFVSMETPPSYPGGIAKFYQFLAENIKYPEEAKKSEIQGNVFASFTVEKDGSLSDIKIDRKLGYGTDEEAIRVLGLSRSWNPGLQKGKPVRVKYSIPIKFHLNNKAKTGTEATTAKVMGEPVDKNLFLKKPSYPGDKEPLYILDGKTFEGNIKDLDPDEIESVTVLKDASAKALYGEKGKNGAVIIVSKEAPKVITITPQKNQ